MGKYILNRNKVPKVFQSQRLMIKKQFKNTASQNTFPGIKRRIKLLQMYVEKEKDEYIFVTCNLNTVSKA